MRKSTILAGMMIPLAALAEPGMNGRDAFLKRQAYEEMQRVTGQMDILEQNHNMLAERVARIERGGGEVRELKAEIDALRAELNRLRNEMQAQRNEIVSDIVKRIQQLPKPQQPPPPPAAQRHEATRTGPCLEYTVKPGDTLWVIADAFGTTVGKLREMNSLKSDMLRVGQKILVPQEPSKRR